MKICHLKFWLTHKGLATNMKTRSKMWIAQETVEEDGRKMNAIRGNFCPKMRRRPNWDYKNTFCSTIQNVVEGFADEFNRRTTVTKTIVTPVPSKGIRMKSFVRRYDGEKGVAFGVEIVCEEVNIKRSGNNFEN